MDNNTRIIIAEGAAGTGKTFASIAAALQLQLEKKYKRIVYTRSVTQVGEEIGYLPGDVNEKVDPFMAPLSDTIDSICRLSEWKSLDPKSVKMKFETMPIVFMRGRNLADDTILIVDESQNLTFIELQTLLTRMSEYSKIILLGSIKQIDNPKLARKEKCDFQKTYEALQELPYVGFVHLDKSMRSTWCVEVDEVIEKLKKQEK